MELLIRYIIMSSMLGFAGNKVLNKHGKSNEISVKWACITGSIGAIVHLILINM